MDDDNWGKTVAVTSGVRGEFVVARSSDVPTPDAIQRVHNAMAKADMPVPVIQVWTGNEMDRYCQDTYFSGGSLPDVWRVKRLDVPDVGYMLMLRSDVANAHVRCVCGLTHSSQRVVSTPIFFCDHCGVVTEINDSGWLHTPEHRWETLVCENMRCQAVIRLPGSCDESFCLQCGWQAYQLEGRFHFRPPPRPPVTTSRPRRVVIDGG